MTTASRPASALPEVIKNLLIINGLFFLAQLVFRAQSANPIFGPLEQWLALWPLGNPDLLPTDAGTFPLGSFYPWQLLTSGFLHADG